LVRFLGDRGVKEKFNTSTANEDRGRELKVVDPVRKGGPDRSKASHGAGL